MLERVSGVRLFNEMRHIFDEQEAVTCILRLEYFDILRAIHPQLKLQPAKTALLKELDEVLAWYKRMYIGKTPKTWVLFLLAMLRGAKYPDVSAVLDRFAFIQKSKTEFLRLREYLRQVMGKLPIWKEKDGSKSGLYSILVPMPVEGLLMLIAENVDDPLSKDISYFLTRLHTEKPDITGTDLASLGETPGPAYGTILKEVLAAKLDGTVHSREEQLALASKLFFQKKEGNAAPFAIPEVLNGRT
jgi:tRNA nucleotidyltransferase (CCA-adding enzyme)